MSQTITVARATALVWMSELAGAFNVSRLRVLLCAAFTVAGILALGLALGLTTVSTLSSQVPAPIAAFMVETAASGALLSAALVTVVLALTAPAGSALDHLLCLLPVTNSARAIGRSLPLTVLTTIGSTALCVPAMLVAGRVLDLIEATRYVVALLAGVALVEALAQGLLHAVGSLMQSWLRTPFAVSSTISGAVTIGAALVAFGPGVVVPSGLAPDDAPAFSLPRLISDVATSRRPDLAWPVFVSYFVVTIVFVWAVSKISTSKAVPSAFALLPADRILRGPQGPFLSQLLVMIRAPQTSLAIAGAICLLATTAWALPPSVPAEVHDGLAMAVPSAGCALVLFGPGRVLPWAWTGTALGRRRTWWFAPVAVAHVVAAALAWTGLSGAALLLGVVQFDELPGMVFRATLLFLSAALAGALVPWSDTQPMSGSVGLMLTTVLYLGCSSLISYLDQLAGPLKVLGSICCICLLIAGTVTTCIRLTSSR
ncbi:hypothetical protein [Curtobacterium aurantiacum]|uniref:hypothetical protein n=1 Tax=Curtobacterium aurantiacum TaxID=3236919 RepID=UPI001BDEDF69|nr:hypothetical protein [Curtobacterium flaccumfaciens]MBT1679808.1 hypothetical protein [Curtobacterium flaccumfaciens pv. flaccumfaciens]